MGEGSNPIRSGDYLLAVLGLAALRDLFHAPDQVPTRAAEMVHVVDHADEFPFNFTVRFQEHDIVEGYTAWSASYDRPGTNPAILLEEELTTPVLAAAPRGRALDVACGTGRQVARLLELGDEVSGVDVTPAMLERARERCPDADLRVGDWTTLPFPDDAFDLVTCALALCHAVEIAPPLLEMARVLRPGGWLVVSDIHPYATLHGGAAGFSGDGIDHVPFVRNRVHHISEYFTAMAAAGLEVRDVVEGMATEEHAALLPSHAAFPEATVRAFADTPAIVVWTAVKPGP